MRVTSSSPPAMPTGKLVANSAREIAAFIKLSPEQHRKIAELVCQISERMGKLGIELLGDFTKSISEGNLEEFSKRWAEKKIPMSILSDLLAISQEMESNTREKVDALILKAKNGAIQLSRHALLKAISLALI